MPITISAAAKAAGAAHFGAIRRNASQTRTIGPTCHGCATKPLTGVRQSSSTIPASIAWAIGVGIDAISAPSRGHRPVSTISAPVDQERADRRRPAAMDRPRCSPAAPRPASTRRAGSESGGGWPADRADACGHRHREQPGGRLHRRGTDSAQPGQHDGRSAGVADERADDPGQNRLLAGSLAERRTRVAGQFHLMPERPRSCCRWAAGRCRRPRRSRRPR